ncbi:putative hydroxymethyltransferase [Annulohypoxylon bovei var. microspora]|nr:putative hydroxymethyltransferase [Annulohypoxylon bovei var. microspora]
MPQATPKIVCRTVVSNDATEYYGKLVNDSIRYDDDTSVTIKKFLGVKFMSPTAKGIALEMDPWYEYQTDIFTEVLDSGITDVTAKIYYEHEFALRDSLSWEINDNLKADPDLWTESFHLYADYLPSGTLKIEYDPAPDPALEGAEQTVKLQKGTQTISLTGTPGETKSYTVEVGTWKVVATEISTSDGTVVAPAQASPDQIEVRLNKESDIAVTYGEIQRYCTIDVHIGSLSTPIDTEQLHVQVIDHDTQKLYGDFFSLNDRTKELRRIPTEGSVDICAWLVLNNVQYDALQTKQLSNSLIEVSINKDDIKTKNIDLPELVVLPVSVQPFLSDSKETAPVRLTSKSKEFIYAQQVSVSSDYTEFPIPVLPQEYTVNVAGFIDDSTVYAVEGPATLPVRDDGSTVLELTTRQGANLCVPGFPNFLSFGALTDLVEPTGGDFVAADAYSVFKYAGVDGDGEPGRFLTEDGSTTATVKLAEDVAEQLGHPVLPVMISYTVNFSQGEPKVHLKNQEGLMHSFGNLILSLKISQETGTQSVPAGYIVNPDFLGECQKGVETDYAMIVKCPLKKALEHWEIDADVPDDITEDLKGYVAAVNWLIQTVANKVTFGWQANLWGGGTSTWIYDSDPDIPAKKAKETADYVKKLGVYSGKYRPNFLAIDRYEADDFTKRGYLNGYCYGPHEWPRFYEFCRILSLELQVPVMPWQIPASRIPNRNECVETNPDTQHWGTGGTYIFGDKAINWDYHNIHPRILEIKLNPTIFKHGSVEELFCSAQPYDLSYPTYQDFPLRGIFAVLLGGGSTTGIVSTIGLTGPWTQDKVKGYMENPIPLNTTSS